MLSLHEGPELLKIPVFANDLGEARSDERILHQSGAEPLVWNLLYRQAPFARSLGQVADKLRYQFGGIGRKIEHGLPLQLGLGGTFTAYVLT
jgi:hypothetical protein